MSLDRDILSVALPSYEIGAELGRGAFGIVFAGVHRQLGREVAIKELVTDVGGDSAGRARFLSEARVLASMDHPHIVPIFDFVEHEGACLLVMERLPGGTLWTRMGTRDVDDRFACAAALAVAAGLEYAHRRKVLHRDIKPENLMFSADGVLKVTDFGIAKVVGGAMSTATRAGAAIGTPAYMAPEQALGQPLSPATDVYALGTVLYEMMAGQLPYPEVTDEIASLYQHVHEEPLPVAEVAPTLPRPIAQVIDRSIARSLDVRYPTAAAFQAALADAVVQAWGPGWASAPVLPLHDIAAIPRPSERGSQDPPVAAATVPPPPATAEPPVTTLEGPVVAAPAAATIAPQPAPPAYAPPPVPPSYAPPPGPPPAVPPPAVPPYAPPPGAPPPGPPPPGPPPPVPPPPGPPPPAAPRPPGARNRWLIPALAAAAAVIVVAVVVGIIASGQKSPSREVLAPPVTLATATTTRGATPVTVSARLARFPQATCVSGSGANLGTPADYFQFAFHGTPRGITICHDSAGTTQLFLPACPTTGCGPLLLAVSDTAGQYRSRADSTGRTYSLDGVAFSLFDPSGGVVELFTVTDSSRPPGAGSIDVLPAYEELLAISSQSRALTQQLGDGISNCTVASAVAIADIDQVTRGRSEVLSAATHIKAAHPDTLIPMSRFITAMSDSLQADQAWSRWIRRLWAPFADGGCNGSITQAGDPDFDSFTQLSTKATQDKTDFLKFFNPEAALRNQRSDWTADHL